MMRDRRALRGGAYSGRIGGIPRGNGWQCYVVTAAEEKHGQLSRATVLGRCFRYGAECERERRPLENAPDRPAGRPQALIVTALDGRCTHRAGAVCVTYFDTRSGRHDYQCATDKESCEFVRARQRASSAYSQFSACGWVR